MGSRSRCYRRGAEARGQREKASDLRATRALAKDALDGKYQHSFSTIDAETIVETVLDIATAAGIDEPLFDRVIDPVRTF